MSSTQSLSKYMTNLLSSSYLWCVVNVAVLYLVWPYSRFWLPWICKSGRFFFCRLHLCFSLPVIVAPADVNSCSRSFSNWCSSCYSLHAGCGKKHASARQNSKTRHHSSSAAFLHDPWWHARQLYALITVGITMIITCTDQGSVSSYLMQFSSVHCYWMQFNSPVHCYIH